MKTFENVAALKLAKLKDSQFVETSGYYEKGGFGACRYFIKTAEQTIADGDFYNATSKGNILLANGNVAIIDNTDKVIDVVSYGAYVDGSGDSTESWVEAANALKEGYTFKATHGNFKLSAEVSIPACSNSTLDFEGSEITQTNASAEGLLKIINTSTQYTLSQSVVRGNGAIKLSGAPSIERGQLLSVNSSVSWFTTSIGTSRNNKCGEAVFLDRNNLNDLNELVLYGDGFLFDYAISDTPTVLVWDFVDNIHIRGGIFNTDILDATAGCFAFVGITDLNITDITLRDFGSGIYTKYCGDVNITNIRSKFLYKSNYGYTINIGEFCNNVAVSGCVGNYGRHFVTTAGEAGISKNIHISNNSIKGTTSAAIDTHAQGHNVNITGNTISGCKRGIGARSPKTTITNNTITNILQPAQWTATSNVTNAFGIFVDEMGHINLTIQGNTIENPTEYGALQGYPDGMYPVHADGIKITPYTNDAVSYFDNAYVVIKDNAIRYFPNGSGISYASMSGVTHPTKIDVIGNIIEQIGYQNINITAGEVGDRACIVVFKDNRYGESLRNVDQIIVKNGLHFQDIHNVYSYHSEVNIQIENFTRAVVDSKRMMLGESNFNYSFMPNLVNVDRGDVTQWGLGYTSKTLELHNDNVQNLVIQSRDGSSFSEWLVSSSGTIKTHEFGVIPATVTVSNGELLISQFEDFFYSIEPKINFTGTL